MDKSNYRMETTVRTGSTLNREDLLTELKRILREDHEGFLTEDEVTATAEYQAGRILALIVPLPQWVEVDDLNDFQQPNRIGRALVEYDGPTILHVYVPGDNA